MTRSILLLGESGSGKTHYGAQLLGRLNSRGGVLRMNGAAPTLTAFEAALQRLNDGLAADHTAQATYHDSHWPVIDAQGRGADMYWPDYGGEQVKEILDRRVISTSWRDRAVAGQDWILMVRPHQTMRSADVFTKPLAELRGRVAPTDGFRLSDQARAVELLQMLLYARGLGVRHRLTAPSLTVLLSCWDELGASDKARPADVLAESLPLLADFVRANWRDDALSVMGLSALERSLSTSERDEDYVSAGPEAFGYVVDAQGCHDRDLTLPVARLLARS